LRALAAHIGDVKFSAALVREVLGPHTVKRVADEFGVALTEKSAAAVLLLSRFRSTWSRDEFARAAKREFKFDLGKFEKSLAAQAGKATKVAAGNRPKRAPKAARARKA
jgi:hypothetical protein